MFVASEDATPGSVIAKEDRISPASNSSSHCVRCCSLPKCVRTSMLPVSGAEQFNTAGARWGLRPGDLGQRRVLEVGQSRPVLAGPGRFHSPRLRATVRNWRSSGTESHAHGSGRSSSWAWNTNSARPHLRIHEFQEVRAHLLGALVELEVHQQFSFNEARPVSSNGMTESPMCSKPAPTVWPLR